jgi:hypothetical protein
VADPIVPHVVEQSRQARGEIGEIEMAMGIDEHSFEIK